MIVPVNYLSTLNNLYLPQAKLTIYPKRSLLFRDKIFNNLPLEIKNVSGSQKKFKTALKQFLCNYSFYILEEYINQSWIIYCGKIPYYIGTSFGVLSMYIGLWVVWWLRHWATSQKVPGSFSGGVNGDFFHGIQQFRVPRVDSASKNKYQDTPGGKDGRCVWLTTYHLQVLMSRNLEALNSQNPMDPIGL
jgi:hypothetical protein